MNITKENLMKYRITPLLIGDMERFTVKTKDHWWNRWHFIFDGRYPRLFSSEDLKKYFKISIQWGKLWKKIMWVLKSQTNSLRVNYTNLLNHYILYFKSEELAKQAIEILGEETIKLAFCTDY